MDIVPRKRRRSQKNLGSTYVTKTSGAQFSAQSSSQPPEKPRVTISRFAQRSSQGRFQVTTLPVERVASDDGDDVSMDRGTPQTGAGSSALADTEPEPRSSTIIDIDEVCPCTYHFFQISSLEGGFLSSVETAALGCAPPAHLSG